MGVGLKHQCTTYGYTTYIGTCFDLNISLGHTAIKMATPLKKTFLKNLKKKFEFE